MSDGDYPEDVYSSDLEPAVIGSGGRPERIRKPGHSRYHRRRGLFRTVGPDGVLGCHYCKEKFPVAEMTEDHIVPKARNGSNKLFNIVPACKPCNGAKGNDWPTCLCGYCQNSIKYHLGLIPR